MKALLKKLAKRILREELGERHQYALETAAMLHNERVHSADLRRKLKEAKPFTEEDLRERAKWLLGDSREEVRTAACVVLAITERSQPHQGFGVVHPADRWQVPRSLFA